MWPVACGGSYLPGIFTCLCLEISSSPPFTTTTMLARRATPLLFRASTAVRGNAPARADVPMHLDKHWKSFRAQDGLVSLIGDRGGEEKGRGYETFFVVAD